MSQNSRLGANQNSGSRRPLFSAVILDMDGVVLDSEPTYRAAWISAAIELGFELTEEICLSYSGKSFQEIEDLLLSEFGSKFSMTEFKELSTVFWHQNAELKGIVTKTGLNGLLDTLRHLKISYCLATNSATKNVEKCLEYAGLNGAFPLILSSDQVAAAKPAPDIYFAAAQKLGVYPERCVVVEDSETGLMSAHGAGTVPILIPDGVSLEPSVRRLSFAVLDGLGDFEDWVIKAFEQGQIV